eukprot:TRINITY_DN18066_c0_g1_i1.p1 TRINITY_DN18066_c0_g1~~TRINITY_DN18066_c0_g1_i1.p1  ORF type:complete len:315 (+),score=54.76 TRINITY_DN18066_c0_g1_i1:77-1021(+)
MFSFALFKGVFFFFQAEDGIRDVERSRGLGDVYKRQVSTQSTWEKRIMEKMMQDVRIVGKIKCYSGIVIVFCSILLDVFGALLGNFALFGISNSKKTWKKWRSLCFTMHMLSVFCSFVIIVILCNFAYNNFFSGLEYMLDVIFFWGELILILSTFIKLIFTSYLYFIYTIAYEIEEIQGENDEIPRPEYAGYPPPLLLNNQGKNYPISEEDSHRGVPQSISQKSLRPSGKYLPPEDISARENVQNLLCANNIFFHKIYVTILNFKTVSYTHLRAHETSLHLVCRLLLEKKKKHPQTMQNQTSMPHQHSNQQIPT